MILTITNAQMRYRGLSDDETFKLIKEAGFDGVDYSFFTKKSLDDAWEALETDDYLTTAKEIKRLLDKHGLVCNQAHAPFKFSYGDSMSLSSKNYLDLVNSIKMAAYIGASAIVVHAVKLPADVDFLEYHYKFYKSLEPFAKECGIKIAVENLVNSIFWAPNRLSGFIRMLESDVFCACIDVGHAQLTGYAPSSFIREMDAGVLKCVHIQDTDAKVDQHWIPMFGNNDWDAIIKALADYGFDGDMNLEVIHSYDNLPDELLLPCLKYTASVGRYLIKRLKDI